MATQTTMPELLAPAGTIEAGLTALDAGADAVYAGLAKFNARERGQNFTFENFSKLLATAHRRGRRVYLTLNTLLKEAELPEVADMLSELALIRPDAIIVQDLGLIRLLRERYPELEIHGSTQMAIHNSAGVEIAAKLGIRRVILERQVTFTELEKMRLTARASGVELEVFIHGALCCSRSGVCLFSSWMGGHSGNRGKCKQPCRRRYHGSDGNGFFFSPSDLYGLEDIETLVGMGIEGFKIEGRLRKPDYVKRVVTAYRGAIDAFAPGVSKADRTKALSESKAILAGALGRRWHQSFRTAKDFKDTIRHETLGTSGQLVGKVNRAGGGGIAVELSRSIHLYDTIRAQPRSGDEGPSTTVTMLKIGRRKVKSARKGQTVWIPFEERVDPGSLVYRTGSSTDDLSERVASLAFARPKVDLRIRVNAASIVVETGPAVVGWRQELALEPAKKHSLEAATVEEQFRKTRSERFAAGRVEVEVEGEHFWPAAQLKRVRRTFWEWLDEALSEEALRAAWSERRVGFDAWLAAHEFPTERERETVVLVGKRGKSPKKGTTTARRIGDIGADGKGAGPNDEILLPDFCAEGRLEELRERVASVAASGRRRFRVTSLYGFALLPDGVELRISASFPLPVCNSLAVAELAELGASRATAWVELERRAIEALQERCGGMIELYVYGRLPILSTRLVIPAQGHIKDGRGAGFRLEREEGMTNLYPDRVFSIPAVGGLSRFIDLTHAKLGERETSDFNLLRELV